MQKKFIFLKTKKVAGTSLEISLSKYCEAGDIITPISLADEVTRTQLGYLGPQKYRKPLFQYGARDIGYLALRRRPAVSFYNHITATDLVSKIDRDNWKNYLKISIVRNPYDYAVSMYCWAQRHAETYLDFRDYLLSNPEILIENRKITDVFGKSAVDFMVRYESFEGDLGALSSKLGLKNNLWNEFKKVSSKGGIRPVSASTEKMFSGFEEGIELVKILCAEDIRKYSYLPPEG